MGKWFKGSACFCSMPAAVRVCLWALAHAVFEIPAQTGPLKLRLFDEQPWLTRDPRFVTAGARADRLRLRIECKCTSDSSGAVDSYCARNLPPLYGTNDVRIVVALPSAMPTLPHSPKLCMCLDESHDWTCLNADVFAANDNIRLSSLLHGWHVLRARVHLHYPPRTLFAELAFFVALLQPDAVEDPLRRGLTSPLPALR